MSMLFSNPKQEKLILIINVGSCMIHGLLVLIKDGEHPKSVFSCNSLVNLSKLTDKEQLVKKAEHGVQEIIDLINRYLYLIPADNTIPRRISEIHYALSSPWIYSQAKLISVSFDKNTIISHSYILKLIETERAKLQPLQVDPTFIIEEKIFDVRLNGYSVTNWQNMEAKSVDVSFTFSVASINTINRFSMLCEHIVHKTHIYFHSTLLLQYIGVQKSLNISEDYILIHVHGELTDLTIVHNQVCTFFGSFQFGIKTFVKKIALATKTKQNTADSFVTLFAGNHLNSIQNKKSYNVIEKVSDQWLVELQKVIDIYSQKAWLNRTIVLSTCAHEQLFAEILKKVYPHSKILIVSEIDLLPAAVHTLDKY